MDESLTKFCKDFNLFRRFKIDEEQISNLDIVLTSFIYYQ